MQHQTIGIIGGAIKILILSLGLLALATSLILMPPKFFDARSFAETDPDKYTSLGDGWHRIDLGPFSIDTPDRFYHVRKGGIDSYVGLIIDRKDSMHFDFGWYSYSYGDGRYLRSHDTIHGQKVIIAFKNDHIAGVHFPLLNKSNKLTVSTAQLSDQDNRRIIRSIKINGISGPTSSVLGQNKESDLFISGSSLFKANCTSCHHLDKKIIGPALRGVVSRTSVEWFTNWVKNPMEFIRTNPRAAQLFEEYNQTQHIRFSTFTDEQIKSLIEFVEQERQHAVPEKNYPRVVACQ